MGCGLDVHLVGGEALAFRPSPDYPVNLGVACATGWDARSHRCARSERATRAARADAARHATSRSPGTTRSTASRGSSTRSRSAADRMRAAFLTNGTLPTEELAFLGALAKLGLGIRHGASAQPAAAPYAEKLRLRGPAVHVSRPRGVGHDRARRRRPRRPRTRSSGSASSGTASGPRSSSSIRSARTRAAAATQHLAIRPGSERALFHGLARFFIARDWIDPAFIAAHTSGLARMQAHAAAFAPDRVCAETGLSPDAFERLARTVHEGRLVSFWWTDGSAAAPGRPGRSSTWRSSRATSDGPAPARTRSASSRTRSVREPLRQHDAIARRARLREPGDRADVAPHPRRARGGRARDARLRLATRSSTAIEARVVTAVWMVGVPAPARPVGSTAALAKLDLLVVQDTRADGEIARLAHLVLPAAGWGEKDGTYINAERRIGLTKKIARPPGQALADFTIFRAVAAHAGVGDRFAAWTGAGIGLRDPEGALCRPSHATSAGSTATGCSTPTAACSGRIPRALPRRARERRLFADGRFFTPDGRARLVVDALPA